MKRIKWILIIALFAIIRSTKPMEVAQDEAPNLGTMPQPVIEQICKHLPLKDIVQYKRLCKAWSTAWDHEKELKFERDDLEVMGAGGIQIMIQSPNENWNRQEILDRGFTAMATKLLSCQNPVNLDLGSYDFTDMLSSCAPLGRLVKTLRLSTQNYGKKTLAQFFKWAPSLIALDIACSIRKLPEELMTLKNLKKLIYRNHFPIDKNLQIIFNIESLQSLDLSSCDIGELPKKINLKNIQELILHGNELTDVTALCNCQTLENLDLSFNNLTDLPFEICTLRQLRTLNLKYNKRLTQAAITTICSLPNLQNLDLSHTKVTSIPEEIAQLKKTLKTLNLVSTNLDRAAKRHIERLLPNTEIIF